MTRGARAAAAGIVLLTLAGCSRDEARGRTPLPPITPTVTASAAPSVPSATPTPTRNATPEAEVVSFVERYFDETNRASATGEVQAWQAMMTNDCVCRRLAKKIEDLFDAGSIRGLRWTVRDVDVRGLSKDDAKITVIYDVSEHDDLDKDGNVVTHYPEYKNANDAMTLIKVRGEWRVSHVVLVSRGEIQ